jgi:hypothetical protein
MTKRDGGADIRKIITSGEGGDLRGKEKVSDEEVKEQQDEEKGGDEEQGGGGEEREQRE